MGSVLSAGRVMEKYAQEMIIKRSVVKTIYVILLQYAVKYQILLYVHVLSGSLAMESDQMDVPQA